MSQDQFFQWHPSARLFAGTHEVTRGSPPERKPFQAIDARETVPALRALAPLLGAGTAFCLFDTPPPTDGAAAGQFITLTGGTSGRPKGVRRSHTSWIASFEVNARLFRYRQTEALAVLGKLSHSLALYGVLEGLHLGMDAHALDMLSPPQQRDALARRGATILYATPTQLRLLCTRAGSARLPDVRLILCGGGQLDQRTAQAVSVLCPKAGVYVFYGAAETSFITLSDAETPSETVGKAYPAVTLDLRGPEGEIWVKSPYLFEDYAFGGDGQTADPEGFFTIGELGAYDAAGNLVLRGRRSRMVQIADHAVQLEAVEAVIMEVPGIVDCAVVPVRDRLRGHRLVAFVEAADTPDLRTAIQVACAQRLGALAAPRKVTILEALPQLASGKPDLVALAEQAEAIA